ncbi:winged helix-turn-helix domain-containing protein [Pseudescherichia vulneris]|uniref:Putative transcriptional regulator n=1 Tax=Pseudescherichia vulneris NBRC 102420 TaxID=1115515 RepID=A0A090V645_PSEVU|nr:transcriptional regulator [Pseudescherichia vulneris]GAL58729.1 putative transcriptional regulator [Pseudescherichia vulneris NBRC 102420]STQ58834.1 lateral flagellar transcriptional regulator [Pseudescherichia vulneris]
MQMLINKWRLDPSLNALVHTETGEVQRLGEFHYILLETLINHAGEVLSRNFLINAVWKNRVVGNNSLPTAIYALRAALGDDGRLQEIIKTVPKKGYVFNKDFITYPNEPLLTERPDEKDNQAPSPGLPHAPPLRRRLATLRLKKIIIISVALIALIYLLIKYHPQLAQGKEAAPSLSDESKLTLKNETSKDYSRISIYHLHAGNDPGHTAQLAKYMPDALRAINDKLQTQRMNAVFYYSESVAKLSISLLIQDNCHNQYQLMLGITNWQSGMNNLNSVVYQTAEKTINEIPVCQ